MTDRKSETRSVDPVGDGINISLKIQHVKFISNGAVQEYVVPGRLETDSEPPKLEPPKKKVRLSLKLKQKTSRSPLLFHARSLIKW